MSDSVDIAGLEKAAVLAVLYNAAAPHRMGFLQYDPAPLCVHEAEEVLARRDPDDQMMVQARRMGLTPEHPGWTWACHCFYYLNGRALPVDISGNTLDASAYDTKHGMGAALHAIEILRTTGDPNHLAIRRAHLNRTVQQARIALREYAETRGRQARHLRATLEKIITRAGQ